METKDTKLQNGKKRKNIYIYDLMPYQQQWLHSQQNQLFKKKRKKKDDYNIISIHRLQ